MKAIDTNGVRILMVDDHAILRKGLSIMLEAQPSISVVAEASSGEEAIAAYELSRPDIVLMDLKMGRMSGVETTELLLSKYPKARVIILSSYDRDEDIYRCIRAGAMAYLVKDASVATILETINAVRNGRKHLPPLIGEKLANRLMIADMSEKELDVLRLLSAGLTNTEIGDQICVSVSAVKYHVNNIMTKLNVTDRTHLMVTALRMGLVEL